MSQLSGSATLLLRSIVLFAILILLPTWAQADDFSFDGGSGCSDPPIFGLQFTFNVNSNGGFCSGFGNHSGMNFDSLRFTTPIGTTSPFCSPEPFFLECTFSLDTVNNILTIDFFGLDRTHQGIPVAPDCPVGTDCLPPDNFFINLNNRVCPPTGGPCTQPFEANGTGDWVPGSTVSGAANGVPEPGTWALLLGGAGALLARIRLERKSRAANWFFG